MKKIMRRLGGALLALMLAVGTLPGDIMVLKAQAATAITLVNSNFATNGYLGTTTATLVNGHQQPYSWVSSTVYGGKSYIPRVGTAVQIGSSDAGATRPIEGLPTIAQPFVGTTGAQILRWTANVASKDGSEVGVNVKVGKSTTGVNSSMHTMVYWGNNIKETYSGPTSALDYLGNLKGSFYESGDSYGLGGSAYAGYETYPNVGAKWYTTTSKTFTQKTGYIVIPSSDTTNYVMSIMARDHKGNTLVNSVKLEQLTAAEINTLCSLGSGVVPKVANVAYNADGSYYMVAGYTANLTSLINNTTDIGSMYFEAQMLDDYTGTCTVTAAKTSLDLNGRAFSNSGTAITVNSGGEITVTGGGMLRSTGGSAIQVNSGGKLNVNTAKPLNSNASSTITGTRGIFNYGTTNIYGNSAIDGTTHAIHNYNSSAALNIYGGVLRHNTSASYAVYNEGGTMNVHGGVIGDAGKSAHAIQNTYINAGAAPILNISGGTIYGIQNGNGGSYGNTVNISGGDFYAPTGGASLYNRWNGPFSLTGGTFEKDYTSSCAAGYACLSAGSGRYEVKGQYKINVSVSGLSMAQSAGTATLTLDSANQPSKLGGSIQLNEGTRSVSVSSNDLEELYILYTLPAGTTITTNRTTRTASNIVYFKPTSKTDTVTVTVSAPMRTLNLTLGANMSVTGGSLTQSVLHGSAIAPITIKANDGYILPASMSLGNGLNYTRKTSGANGDGNEATISGNITGNVTATVQAATLGAAKVGTVGYSTLQNAVAAIGSSGVSGSTITMLSNITLTGTNTFDKTATINGSYTLTTNGSLTLGENMTLQNSGIVVGASNVLTLGANTTVPKISLSQNAYIAFKAAPAKTYTIAPLSPANGAKLVDGSNSGSMALTASDLTKFTLPDLSAWSLYLDGKDIKMGEKYTVSFNVTANGGTLSGDASKAVVWGTPYGTLPTASKSGNIFSGWYTTPDTGGFRALPESIVGYSGTKPTTLYARFTENLEGFPVRIGSNGYANLGAAIAAINGGTETGTAIDIKYDISEPSAFTLTKNVNLTINGNGSIVRFDNSITSAAQGIFTINSGTSVAATDVVFDGGGVARSCPLLYVSSGSLALGNGAIIQGGNNTSNGGALYFMGSGTLTLSQGASVKESKALNGGGIYMNSGFIDINGASVYNNESTNRAPENNTVFHGDAVYIGAGVSAINIDGSKFDVTGDIYLAAGQSINLTSAVKSGAYAILTVASDNYGSSIITGSNAISSYGRVKLTNSGVTLTKGTNTLNLTSSSILVTTLKGSAVDSEFQLGYTSVEAAAADIGQSADGIIYVVNTATIPAGIASTVRIATADRLISGYYGTITTLQNFGSSKNINGLDIGIGNGVGDSLTASLLAMVENERRSVLEEIQISPVLTDATEASLITQLASLYSNHSNAIQNSMTISGQIEAAKEALDAMDTFIENHVFEVKTDVSGGLAYITTGGFYAKGESVTVLAVARNGYKFIEWQNETASISASATYSFTVSRDIALTAVVESLGDTTYSVGGESYDLLADAVNNCTGGETIRLLRDDKEGEIVINKPDLNDVTINLGTNTLEAVTIDVTIGSLIVTNGTIDGDITITSGTVTLEDIVVKKKLTIKSGADVTITGGRYEGELIVEEGASVSITGGYFTSDPSSLLKAPYSAVKVTQGTETFWEIGHFVSFTLSRSGSGLLYIDGTETNGFTEIKYLYGTSFTLSASAQSDSVFSYWADANKRVISHDKNYAFTLVSDTEITAVYKPRENNMHTVEYRNYNGTVLQKLYLAVGADFTPPQPPFRLEHTFSKWDTDASDIKDSDEDFIVKPIYTQNLDTYNVAIENGTALSQNSTALSIITVKAGEPSGNQKFSHWEKDGKKISSQKIYSFVLTNDVSVRAVFVDNETVAVPVVSITSVKTNGDIKTFISERSVPSEYTVIEHGVVLSASPESFDLYTSGVTIAKSVDKTSTGTYVVNKMHGGTWYARGYMICIKGGEYTTYYSEIEY